jgi:bifunctional UDP-N-acetylglucosamine pyrophosphorylase/glucosamine-1-phosphate N-acetyltransferase
MPDQDLQRKRTVLWHYGISITNVQAELVEMGGILRQKKEELMAASVTIDDPSTTYIDVTVSVGKNTVIHPGVHLQGITRIGDACEIHPGVRIVNSMLGDNVIVLDSCLISDSTIASGATVGPFAHLRPGSRVGEQANVGNFVELKKTTLGKGSKANHLSYLGDATIGKNVNIGAGTITCNYDGQQKHATVIEDNVFIGSSTQLIAPVRIGEGAFTGAGSSITDDVPAEALGLGRAKQVNKKGWAKRNKQS